MEFDMVKLEEHIKEMRKTEEQYKKSRGVQRQHYKKHFNRLITELIICLKYLEIE